MMLDEIELPDDLLWINEFDWNPVEQSQERSLNGALLVQEQGKQYGRSIVLSGGEGAGWVSRSVVIDLFVLSSIANKVMTLTLPDLRQFSVIFDRSVSPIDASLVFPEANPGDESYYHLSLSLLTVA